jgi:ADP-heptose:LPS heptosyltransferase
VARSLPAGARILIVRFGSLGDVVKCTALPRLIRARYPRAHLTMLTSEAFVELIRDNPHLDRALAYDRRSGPAGLLALGKRLRAEGVHLLVDVHKSLRSRLLRAIVGAPSVAYSKRTWQRFLLIRFRWNTYDRARGKEEDFLAAVAPYGVVDDGRGTEVNVARFGRDDLWRQRFAGELERFATWRRERRPVLGIAPVAAWELKRWPMAHVRELARAFHRETGGGLVLFGGPGDGDVAALGGEIGAPALSLVGRTSHLESAYFASLCDVVVANDTGMSHLAEAVGTDVVTLFGPTSRELGYYPVRPASVALERDLPCRPCTRMGEGRCTHPWRSACLAGIAPAEVLGHVLDRVRRKVAERRGPDPEPKPEPTAGRKHRC